MPAIGTLAPLGCAQTTKRPLSVANAWPGGHGGAHARLSRPHSFGLECLRASELDRRRGSGDSGSGGRLMGIRLTTRRLLVGYAVWMALLVAAHYTFTGIQPETVVLVGVTAVAAMLGGVMRNRPARRTPWLLLAAANLAVALGVLGLHVATMVSHPAVPFPPFADGAHLVAYPLYVAGLTLFI